MKTRTVGDVVFTKKLFESTRSFNKRVEKEWRKFELQRLKNFRKEIFALKKNAPPLENYRDWLLFSVEFFQVFSDEYDRGRYSYLPESEELNIVNRCISNGGREEYGINRTKRGEKVTTENVYWGNLEKYGCITRTVKEYVEEKHRSSPVLCEAQLFSNSYVDCDDEAEKVVRVQVIPFIKYYLDGALITALDRLTADECV